ncbi:MAG TPA: c-type cytochrome [Bryobacteraceae bacterium]|nr:c-type cytochrome [Bryobacteraceae bacterium]
MWSRRLLVLALTAGAAFAQPGYSPADVAAGKQLYGVNCSNCHGPNGDFVSGVDLGHGHFRRASTDNDLVAIMQQGIQGTPMPPANLSDTQAHQIVAYLRSMAASFESNSGATKADIARGKSIFESKGCLNCHRVGDRGSRVGPDLTDIGARRQPADIERSIVDPNAEILPENRYVRAVTRDGATITGRILNEDTYSLQLIDSKQKLVSLQKSDLRSFEFLKASPMPSYRDKLSGSELSDLVGYLVSLKGM